MQRWTVLFIKMFIVVVMAVSVFGCACNNESDDESDDENDGGDNFDDNFSDDDDDTIDDDNVDDDDDDNQDDDDDDDFPLFVISKGSGKGDSFGYLRTSHNNWESFPLPNSIDGLSCINGETVFAVENIYYENFPWIDDPVSFEVFTFTMDEEWKSQYKNQFAVNLKQMHPVSSDKWVAGLERVFQWSAVPFFGTYNLGIFNSSYISGKQIDGMFFFELGEGLYSKSGYGETKVIKVSGGQETDDKIPEEFIEGEVWGFWMFDMDNGWALAKDDSSMNYMIRKEQGIWSLVDHPANCYSLEPIKLMFADENFGVALVDGRTSEYLIYQDGDWNCTSLPEAMTGPVYQTNIHVISPGHYFMGVWDTDKATLLEIKDGDVTKVYLPTGATYRMLNAVFTFGPKAPQYAPR